MRTDTSNNTVYADADGNIAYFHGNFIPKRDPRFDYTRPVDGSNPATEWQGPHALEDTITLLNPSNGWIQNTNDWPFSAAGAESPKRENYPAYMWTRGETPRGLHAVEVLEHIHDVTLERLIAAAYDPHLTAFEALLPRLLEAYDRLAADDPRRQGIGNTDRGAARLEPKDECGFRGRDARYFLGTGADRRQQRAGARRASHALRLSPRASEGRGGARGLAQSRSAPRARLRNLAARVGRGQSISTPDG